MSVTDVRYALAEALEATGLKVHAFPPPTVTPPALVLVPADPYLDPATIGRGTVRLFVRLRLTFLAGLLDNPSSLARIEDAYLQVAAVLPSGFVLGPLSRPGQTQVGPSELLAADCEITATVTATLPDPDLDLEPEPEGALA